jgi:hypothetical protein
MIEMETFTEFCIRRVDELLALYGKRNARPAVQKKRRAER